MICKIYIELALTQTLRGELFVSWLNTNKFLFGRYYCDDIFGFSIHAKILIYVNNQDMFHIINKNISNDNFLSPL